MNHDWQSPDDSPYRCTRCSQVYGPRVTSYCPGVTVYTWEQQPEYLKSETLLRKAGLKPGGEAVGARWSGMLKAYVMLYDERTAIPRPTATPAQLAALERGRLKKRTCDRCGTVMEHEWMLNEYSHQCAECDRAVDLDSAIKWARDLLAHPGWWVIVDTETTDLFGEPVQIAVTDSEGRVLFESLVRPIGKMTKGATWVNGITDDDLVDAPLFPLAWLQLAPVLLNCRRIVAYNVEFDRYVMEHALLRYHLPLPEWKWTDAMHWYAVYVGEIHRVHRDGEVEYKWQSLGGDHTAAGDCLATLEIIQLMAATPLSTEKETERAPA